MSIPAGRRCAHRSRPAEALDAHRFENPFKPGETLMLRPEDSMRIQHSIGADIMMQLDDVVASLTEPIRMKEASERSVRCAFATMADSPDGGQLRRHA